MRLWVHFIFFTAVVSRILTNYLPQFRNLILLFSTTQLCKPLTRLGGSTDFGHSKIVWDPRQSLVLGTRSSEPMHSIRANLYWEFQFVLGYIAVPRSRIRLQTLQGPGVEYAMALETHKITIFLALQL